jgi:hypothetical protein
MSVRGLFAAVLTIGGVVAMMSGRRGVPS